MRKLINTLRQSFKISVQNIITNKMRSFLTMLGIIIGVGSVIGLITIVQGATSSIINQFSELGAGVLTISAPGTAMKSGLTDDDLQQLLKADGVIGISPQVSAGTSAVSQGKLYDSVVVNGYSDAYFAHNSVLESGRALMAADMSGSVNVCIVDHDFIENIMKGQQVIGGSVHLGGTEYQIVGIMADSNSVFSMFNDNSGIDGTVIIPYRNALRMSGSKNVTSVEVYLDTDADTSDIEKQLREILDQIYNKADNAYSVINMESLLDTMNTVRTMLSTMLGGIASIALLVGGIGIMNMMLVSVSERTKEIGLRKALGAEPSRIQAQFLLESVILSVIGGLIGVVFGLLIAYIGAIALETDFALSPGAILLGLGFSAGVGIIFGWAPARRASRLNPIDALRSE